jgi:hypothetical protein
MAALTSPSWDGHRAQSRRIGLPVRLGLFLLKFGHPLFQRIFPCRAIA